MTSMDGQYNKRSPAVKRLMKEAQELSEATNDYYAQPLEDNLFEWHFTVRGPSETEFDGGVYHGRILLPAEYPMKPPNIIILTPNGRFEVGQKICLSISGHHPESWQPSWSIRTALLAIIGFMPTDGKGTIGSLDYTPEERKALAKKSINFKCDVCGPTSNLLKTKSSTESLTDDKIDTMQEANEIIKKMSMKVKGADNKEVENSAASKDATSSGKANEVSEEENEEIKKRKAASKAVINRYRQRLLERTTNLRAQLTSMPPTGPPNASDRTESNVQSRSSSTQGRFTWMDCLILVIIAVIAFIVYRRLS